MPDSIKSAADSDTAQVNETQDDPLKERIASLYAGGIGEWTRVWASDQADLLPKNWSSQNMSG